MSLFWDDEKGLWATNLTNGVRSHYAELTQSLMVLTKADRPESPSSVLQKLANQESDRIPISLRYTIFKYDARMTMPEQYGCLVTEDIARCLGQVLFKGTTSF